MPSTDSSDEDPIPKKTRPPTKSAYATKSKREERRVRCSRLIRNKWFIVGVGAAVLLIILAIVLGCTLGKKSENYIHVEHFPLRWWQNSTIYRIYVTSFTDSDGDGFGDFKGVQERLSYLVEMGVDVLWLSPIQDTNTVSGLDVVNWRTTKDEYGSLTDLNALITAAKALGIKIVMDIILNHSGSAHSWFKQSQLMTDPYRDYYMWNPGRPITGARPAPPNNWVSVYGGSAWTWNVNRQQYYLHQFSELEPDLNYRNPQIINEMNKVVSFWSEQGVDGFFIRDAAWWFEDPQLKDETQLSNSDDYASLSHNFTRDMAESYQAINSIFLSAIGPRLGVDKILLIEGNERVFSDERAGETYQLVTTKHLYKLKNMFTGTDLRDAVQQTIEACNKSQIWPVWTLGDEDRSRIMTKFDQQSVGLQAIQILLPGTYSIYYGEEIQMKDNPMISYDDTMDPVAKKSGPQNYTRLSRDPFHTPMLWNTSRNYGFSSAQSPWLPIYNSGQTVDQMKIRPNSLWQTLKQLGAIKKTSPALYNGTIDFLLTDNEIFSFTRTHPLNRNGFLVVWNIGNQRKTLNFNDATYIPTEMTVIYKVKPDGGRNETSVVKKADVNVEPRELILFSFWK